MRMLGRMRKAGISKLTEGIIQKTFKRYDQLAEYSNETTDHTIIRKMLKQLEQELIKNIDIAFPLENKQHSTVYIRHYLFGDNSI